MGFRKGSVGRAVDVVDICAGGFLIGSAFLAWVRHGPGSSLRGHELVDTLLSLRRSVPAGGALALSSLWYLIPMCGALTLLRVGLSPARRGALLLAVLALGATVFSGFLLWWTIGFADTGVGFWAAFFGAAALVVSELGVRFSFNRVDARVRNATL